MTKRKVNVAILEPFENPDVANLPSSSTKKELDSILIRGFRYYNYSYGLKDSRKWVIEWLKAHNMKKELKVVRAANDNEISFSVGVLCRMMTDGLPELVEYIEKVESAVAKIKPKVEVKKVDNVVPMKSVHDRMVDNMRDWMGENVEGEIDEMHLNKGKSVFKLSDKLAADNIPAKSAMLVAEAYRRERDDLRELVTSKTPDPDLVEAYPYKKAYLKRVLAFYEMLVSDAEYHASKKKAVRKKRRKKGPSVEKRVAAVKYLASHEELKLVSETPDKILDAKEVWLYNARYRKLIHAVAEDVDMGGTLTIRGSTIHNLDKSKSVMKILRKPEVTLAGFKKFGKVKLRKLMDSIKSKPAIFTGRLGKDIMILKVIK